MNLCQCNRLFRLTSLLMMFIILIGCNNKQTKSINLTNTKTVIHNTSENEVEFTLDINNQFPISKERIISNIESLADSLSLNIPVAAWLYVCNTTKHATPITGENWINDPLIYLNSVGIGFCDDQASVLAIIWQWLGYESRVWSLNGHVVPEVNYDSSWHMLDPDYEVYYWNDDGNIASVDQLSKYPNLITRPKSVPSVVKAMSRKENRNYNKKKVRYSRFMTNFYTTYQDNKIAKWYNEPILEQSDFSIILPQKAKMIFPVVYEYPNVDATVGIALKAVVYHSSLSQKVKIPLVLIEARGEEEIKTNDTISSDKRQLMNLNLNFYNQELQIEMTTDSVELFYALNPNLFSLETNITNIQLLGKNAESLSVRSYD